ncbi:hypothetical protein TPY_2149 [Sulfobacillus acidophilus TPY]|nr:hypothetical protein TPY_2149 [Sulfobacillus acidophilus TPY]
MSWVVIPQLGKCVRGIIPDWRRSAKTSASTRGERRRITVGKMRQDTRIMAWRENSRMMSRHAIAHDPSTPDG